jgi:uncharacterized membrane protein YhhN
MQQSFTRFTFLFALIVVAVLSSNFLIGSIPWFHYMVKPLIMISLAVFYLQATAGMRDRLDYILLMAAFFSWLGDIFLMFEGDRFFMLGLGSFLLAQLSYMLLFSRQVRRSGKNGFLRRQPAWMLPLLVYVIALLWLVREGAGNLFIPVVVYGLVITGMALSAINRYQVVGKRTFQWVLAGALLFVLSDSMIALDKFTYALPLARTWILLTYMAAQYLLVGGTLLYRLEQAAAARSKATPA